MKVRRTNAMLILIALMFIVAIIILACIGRKKPQDPDRTEWLQGKPETTTITTEFTSDSTETSDITNTETTTTTSTVTTERETTSTTRIPSEPPTKTSPEPSTTTYVYTEPEVTTEYIDTTTTTEYNDTSTTVDANVTTTPPYDDEMDSTDVYNDTTIVPSTTTTTTEATTTSTTTTTTTTPTTTTTTTTPTTTTTTTTPTTTTTTTTPTTTTTTTTPTTTTTTTTTTEYVPLTTPPPDGYCGTPKCKELASRMLAKIDHSVHPCKNFYKYACGKVDDIDLHQISQETRFLSILKEKLGEMPDSSSPKFLYNDCLENKRKPNSDLSKKIIDSYMIEMREVIETEDLNTILAHFHEFGLKPFFDVSLKWDSGPFAMYSIIVGRPVFALSDFASRKHCLGQLENKVRDGEKVKLQEDFDRCMYDQGLDVRMEEADYKFSNSSYQKIASVLQELMDWHYPEMDVLKTYTEEIDNPTATVSFSDFLSVFGKNGTVINQNQVYVQRKAGSIPIGDVFETLNRLWNKEPQIMRDTMKMLWEEHLKLILKPITEKSDADYCVSVIWELMPATSILVAAENDFFDNDTRISLLDGSQDEFQIFQNTMDYLENVLMLTKLKFNNALEAMSEPPYHPKSDQYLTLLLHLEKKENYLGEAAIPFAIASHDFNDLPVYVKMAQENYGEQDDTDLKERRCDKDDQFLKLNVSGTLVEYDVKGAQVQRRLASISRKLRDNLGIYEEYRIEKDNPKDSLIWLNPETLSGQQVMVLLTAQEFCEPTNRLDLGEYLSGEKVEPEIWVNSLMDSDKTFSDAYNCRKEWLPTITPACPLPLESKKLLFKKSRLS